MNKIINILLLLVFPLLAYSCSDDEPDQITTSSVENAAKNLNGKYSYEYVAYGVPVTETITFSPFSGHQSGAYGHVTYLNTAAPDESIISGTYAFSSNAQYLTLTLRGENSTVSYYLKDVTKNSFKLCTPAFSNQQLVWKTFKK